MRRGTYGCHLASLMSRDVVDNNLGFAVFSEWLGYKAGRPGAAPPCRAGSGRTESKYFNQCGDCCCQASVPGGLVQNRLVQTASGRIIVVLSTITLLDESTLGAYALYSATKLIRTESLFSAERNNPGLVRLGLLLAVKVRKQSADHGWYGQKLQV